MNLQKAIQSVKNGNLNEDKQNLNEGFWGSLIGAIKTVSLVKQLQKDIEKNLKSFDKPSKEEPDILMKMVNSNLEIIKKSKLDGDVKDNFRSGFLTGVMERLYKEVGLSKDDIQKSFKIPENIYKEMRG